MPRQKDKDAEKGLQTLTVLSIFWSIGIAYFSFQGFFDQLGLGQGGMICCNAINLILVMIFLGTWIQTRKENRVKEYLDSRLKAGGTITVDQMTQELAVDKATAVRVLAAWMSQTNARGQYDEVTGVFKARGAIPGEEEIIDAEFVDEPDDAEPELLKFCPDCGGQVSLNVGGTRNYCPNCDKYV